MPWGKDGPGWVRKRIVCRQPRAGARAGLRDPRACCCVFIVYCVTLGGVATRARPAAAAAARSPAHRESDAIPPLTHPTAASLTATARAFAPPPPRNHRPETGQLAGSRARRGAVPACIARHVRARGARAR